MLLKKYFENIYTKPPNVVVNSRDATLYLFRYIFFMGIRPLPKRRAILYIIWSLIVNILITVYAPFAFYLSYINNAKKLTPGEFLSLLQLAFIIWACSVKVVVFWVMVTRLDKANEILDEMDKRCTLKEEQQKIREAASLGNRVIFIMTIMFFSCVLVTFGNALLNGKPPYSYYYPFLKWRASRTQFWIQFFLEFFSVLGSCIQELAIDSYSIIYVINLRNHVNILKERLLRLGTQENQSNDDLYNDLINCILDHKNLIRYYNTIHPVISVIIFVEFLVTGILMGITSTNLLLYADFYTGLATCLFMAGVLSESAPLCFLCSFLTDDWSELSDAAFQSSWTHTETRFKKVLIYFIQNLQTPMVFKALNVVPISISSIISIIKFAFSVFTLVKEMNIAERIAKSE